MNQNLQKISLFLQQDESLSAEEKASLTKAVADAEKEMEITAFKLDRTEKVKRTTAILLEETIEELEHKRKAVEAQNRELEVESSLERVRTVAMGMQNPAEMVDVCKIISEQLEFLKVKDIRNVQTAVIYESKGTYINYEYYARHNKLLATEVSYKTHHLQEQFANQMLKGAGEFFSPSLEGQQVKDWYEYQKTTNQFADSFLEGAQTLNYYMFSLGPVALGISTYSPLKEEEINLFKRFRNVFELAYRRFTDIQKAEAQAREAQIQLAMERVRARTMAMQHSDELADASHLLERQVAALGIKTWGCAFHIFREDDSLEYHSNADGVMPTFVIPRTYVWQRYYESCQRGETLIIEERIGEACTELYEYMAAIHIVGEALQKMKATGIPFPTYQVEHAASFKYGYLLFITFEPVPEAHDIFQRFAKVFEQTYTRFLDLQKTESQAREAQIQLAMERVRARTMAMQRSEELADAAQLLFQQVKELGVHPWTSGFQLWDEDRKAVTVWTSTEGVLLPPFKISVTEDPLMIHIAAAEQKGETLYVEEMGGEVLADHYKYMFSLPSLQEVFAKVAVEGHAPPTFQVNHAAYFSNGYLLFITHEPCPEAHDIFKRFAKVFEQTYTRFLDLQKAEAQARESQIQLALERVRARTMAMQKSDELGEASFELDSQVRALGIKTWGCAFHIFRENDSLEYYSNAYGVMPTFVIPRTYVWQHYYEACQRGETLIIEERVGEACTELYEYTAAMPIMGEELQKMKAAGIPFPTYQVEHAASFKYGYLLFITFEQVPEAHDIFIRFAKVFEQTYTRFLDLQKAEAQAREAKIEAALERVRSRTMAMQRSDELAEAASLLFKQIVDLGTKQWASGFDIWQADDISATAWMSGPDGSVARPFVVPYTEDPFFKKIYESRQSGTAFFVMESSGKELEETYQYMFTLPDAKKYFDAITSSGFQIPTFQITHCVFFPQGFLMFITYEPVPEMWDIFKRFAKVFEQTYTRFLDLQKAEAQTRESQIQLAMERVRARTMAMQKSEELAETAAVLFQQFAALGETPDRISIGIVDEQTDTTDVWATDQAGTRINIHFKARNNERTTIQKILTDWKAGKKSSVVDLQGDNLKDWITYLRTELGMSFNDEYFHGRRLHQVSFFSQGWLNITTLEPLPTETLDLLNRFAAVFTLTYTRFSDLKKAEAQAREAQIQLSLERVRARTMAMQSSSELLANAQVVFEQLKNLKIATSNGIFSFVLINEKAGIFTFWETNFGGQLNSTSYSMPLKEFSMLKDLFKQWKSTPAELRKHKTFIQKYDPEQLKQFVRYLQSINYSAPSAVQLIELLDKGDPENWFKDRFAHYSFFSQGILIYQDDSEISKQDVNVMMRLAQVFEQAYTRFLDLQKAEAQAREAQIETSLERVRSKTMAMHNSDDVGETVATLFDEFEKLGIRTNRCGILIISKESMQAEVWTAKSNPSGKANLIIGQLDLTMHPLLQGLYHAWKSKEPVFNYTMIGDDLKSYYQAINNTKYYPTQFDMDALPAKEFYTDFYFAEGCIFAFTPESIAQEAASIFKRFANVFGQTYRRYLDLQKAEAQAREAKIQLALERVRARTMAMQKSEELADVSYLLNKQVVELGIPTWGCAFNIYNENDSTEWFSNLEGTIPAYHTPRENIFLKYYEAGQRGESLLIEEFAGERIKELYKYFESLNDSENETITNHVAKAPDYQINHMAYFKYGYLLFITSEHFPEMHDTFKRFAKVFEQTYTRFLDLQKAESQAREAKIEAALERVRAKTMAMHKSEQLSETAQVLFEKFAELGKIPDRISIGIIKEELQVIEWWVTDQMGSQLASHFDSSILQATIGEFFTAWKEGKDSTIVDLSGEALNEWIAYVRDEVKMPIDESKIKGRRVHHAAFFLQGLLLISAHEPVPDETMQLLVRFAKVFEQTYTRFLDLQKAEAQAREAQIELGLERVRAKALAMHKSDEIMGVAVTMRKELESLNIPGFDAVTITLRQDDGTIRLWDNTSAKQNEDGTWENTEFIFRLEENNPDFYLNKIWSSNARYFVVEQDENDLVITTDWVRKFDKNLADVVVHHYKENGIKQAWHPTVPLSHGRLNLDFYFHAPEPEVETILLKMATAFDLAYKRFLDLQKAEFQTRQAKIETGLEKVRARALAMQQPEELKEVAQVMRHEMGLLGVEELETSSIYIHEENSDKAECWYAIKDIRLPEKNLVADHFVLNLQDTWVGRQMLAFYQSTEKQSSIPMQGANRMEWINYCSKQSKLLDGFYGDMIPDRTYHLYKFSNGTIGASTKDTISNKSWQLLQRAASVFSLAYSRFKDLTQARIDLQRLKEEKQRAEEALTELKFAQNLLIQKEKLASLGELTAGIAHEIQNPLNFVNNFSELSVELAKELKQERSKVKGERDEELENELVDDLIQNQEKINLHGKRASSIVSGMLEHSRTSTGKRVMTDLNKLADEYLRLSYHGLRAKDNSFNSDYQTDFEKDLPKIEVISQEMGRVLLNLINNAFYAVKNIEKPLVVVKTEQTDTQIIIKVTDNGTGMTDEVKAKIFQPFFTTKPTGQGTGLGLSLAYDIVTKVHGGTLEVNSNEGVGSEFIIQLPIKTNS